MTDLRSIHYCRHCRQVVEVVHCGANALVCCGEPMTLLAGNTTEAATEKHIPVLNDKGDYVEINVGTVAHPMTAEHYIAFIEVLTKDKIYRKELTPTDTSTATFPIKKSEVVETRAFCNLHSLWKNN